MGRSDQGNQNGQGNQGGDQGSGLTLAPGQCVTLTFTGAISFGNGGLTVVPSTASGQVYEVHIIANEGGETTLDCTLPLTATSCVTAHHSQD